MMKCLKLLLPAALYLLPGASTALAAEPVKPVRTLGQVCADIRASGPEAIEGVWRLTDAPAGPPTLIAIERDSLSYGSYVITIVSAPDRSLIPGTLIGRASRGASRGVYDSWMYGAAPLPGMKVSVRKKFTLRLADDATRIEFKPHRSPLAVNLYMSLPYLFFRPSIRNERNVERTPQGAERVFPVPVPPLEPVYL